MKNLSDSVLQCPREVVVEVYEVLQKKRIVRRFDGEVGEYLRKFEP